MTIEQYGTIFAGLIEGQIVIKARLENTTQEWEKEATAKGLARVLAGIETLRAADIEPATRPTLEPRIPTFEECQVDAIEVATPIDRLDTDSETEAKIRNAAHGMYVCWHPDSDDQFRVRGEGHSKAEAYRNMLDALYEEECDRMTDEEEARWNARIQSAKGAA